MKKILGLLALLSVGVVDATPIPTAYDHLGINPDTKKVIVKGASLVLNDGKRMFLDVRDLRVVNTGVPSSSWSNASDDYSVMGYANFLTNDIGLYLTDKTLDQFLLTSPTYDQFISAVTSEGNLLFTSTLVDTFSVTKKGRHGISRGRFSDSEGSFGTIYYSSSPIFPGVRYVGGFGASFEPFGPSFETTVPEPSTAALMIVGVLLISLTITIRYYNK